MGGSIAALYGFIFGIKSNLGKMLFFLGFGLVSFDVGLIIWVYYNLVLNVSIPFPSFADVAFMVFYPLITIGCVYLLAIYKTLISKNLLRDSLIIVILSFIIIFGLFSRPDLSSNLSLLERFINIYYPMGDVVTLSLALIALRIGGGKIHPSLYILVVGLLVQTSADLLFTFRTAKSIYWNGDIADLLYTISGFLISIGLFEIINSLNHAFVQKSQNSEAVHTISSISPTI